VGASWRTVHRWVWCLFPLLFLGALGCGSNQKPAAPRRADVQPSNRPIELAALRGRVVLSRRGDIWSAHADGSGLRRLTARHGPEFDPSWSPDGSRVVYRDSRRGINVNDDIYVMDADGSHRRKLTHELWNEWSPAWSPDGRLIAFYSGELFAMRPDGSDQHAVTSIEGEYPAWSPDGKRLAFMSAEPNARGSDPNYDVFVVSRNGTGLRRLTDWPGEDGWPAWSPDGRSIAFTTTHEVRSGQFDIWVMRADGSRKRRVAPGSFPVWSPDGRFLMFSTGGESQDSNGLSVARPDGSGLRHWPISGWLPDWRP
jgi:Tol biopolymer transport system component